MREHLSFTPLSEELILTLTEQRRDKKITEPQALPFRVEAYGSVFFIFYRKRGIRT